MGQRHPRTVTHTVDVTVHESGRVVSAASRGPARHRPPEASAHVCRTRAAPRSRTRTRLVGFCPGLGMPRRGRFSINRSVLRLVNRLQIAYLENISLTVSDLAFVGRGQCFPGRPPAHRSSPKGHCRGSRFSAPVQLAMLLCSPGFAFSSQRWGPRGAARAEGGAAGGLAPV